MNATSTIPESPSATPIDGRAVETGAVARRPVNVLLLTSSLERGGAERQVVELARSLDASRFRVHVVSLSHDNPLAAQLGEIGERFTVVPKRSRYDVGLIRRVRRYLLEHRIDVVHSFMFDAEMVGRLAGRWAGLPAIICSNRCPHWGRRRFKQWIARATTGCFDMMIANSHAGFAYERDAQHVPADKLRVIPNGVDTRRYSPGRCDALRRTLGIPVDAFVVGMFAHFRVNKDHETWLRAAQRIKADHPGAVFISAGAIDGETPNHYFGRAKRLAAQIGIEGSVRFLAQREDMTDLYRMLDVKVLSSRFEGTPNVVLEAMASGLPVIATDVSDNARIVRHGETGFIVPPQDIEAMARCLNTLATGPALRQRMGAAARARAVEEYSVAALGRRTGDVYLEVLRRNGHRSLEDSR